MKRVRLKNGIIRRSVNGKDYKNSVWQQFLKLRQTLYIKYRGMWQFLKSRRFSYNNSDRLCTDKHERSQTLEQMQ